MVSPLIKNRTTKQGKHSGKPYPRVFYHDARSFTDRCRVSRVAAGNRVVRRNMQTSGCARTKTTPSLQHQANVTDVKRCGHSFKVTLERTQQRHAIEKILRGTSKFRIAKNAAVSSGAICPRTYLPLRATDNSSRVCTICHPCELPTLQFRESRNGEVSMNNDSLPNSHELSE